MYVYLFHRNRSTIGNNFNNKKKYVVSPITLRMFSTEIFFLLSFLKIMLHTPQNARSRMCFCDAKIKLTY